VDGQTSRSITYRVLWLGDVTLLLLMLFPVVLPYLLLFVSLVLLKLSLNPFRDDAVWDLQFQQLARELERVLDLVLLGRIMKLGFSGRSSRAYFAKRVVSGGLRSPTLFPP
jgi:hypothetical protein